jgi:uncharacterized membrane protein YtjA (UPF0391 family)
MWPREVDMVGVALVFFILALVAAVFGFNGMAMGAMGTGKMLFLAFLALAAISLLVGIARARSRSPGW